MGKVEANQDVAEAIWKWTEADQKLAKAIHEAYREWAETYRNLEKADRQDA